MHTLARPFGLIVAASLMACESQASPTDVPTVNDLSSDGSTGDATTGDDVTDDATDAVVDVPRDRTRDLVVRLSGVDPAAGRRATFLLVAQDRRLDALTIIQGLSTGTTTFTMENAVIATGARLDWWIDDNNNGRYDAPPVDRAFSSPLPAASPYAMNLDPSGSTLDLTATPPTVALNAVGHFTGVNHGHGFPFEITVRVADSGQFVGMYRLPMLPASDSVDWTIPGVVRPGVRYTAFWYMDLNRSGTFEERGDHFATITGVPTASGLLIGWDHLANRVWQE